jgi:hypothetical protein
MGRRITLEIAVEDTLLVRQKELLIGTPAEPTVGLYPVLDRWGGVLESMAVRRVNRVAPIFQFVVWLVDRVTTTTALTELEVTATRLLTTALVISDINAPTANPEIRNAPPPYWD